MRVVITVCLAVFPLFSQSTLQDPVIRVSVDLVQVDATVTDSRGRHVPNLKESDFVVLEDGKRQKITHFSYVQGAAAPGSSNPAAKQKDRTPEALNLAPAKPLTQQQVRRTIVMIADDPGLSSDDIPNVRKAMKSFVDRQMQPGDLISVMTSSGGMGAMEQLTNDRSRLYAAIDRIHYVTGRSGQTWYQPTSIGDKTGTFAMSSESVEAAGNARVNGIRSSVLLNQSMGAVSYAIRGLREMPGRKAVALFSDGFGQSPDGIVQLANRASVVLYTFDPRGLASYFLSAVDICRSCGQGAGSRQIAVAESAPVTGREAAFRASQRGMEQLARGTGGLFFHDDNDLGQGLAKALDDMNGYYLIGYQPQREDFNAVQGAAAFHKIEVKVVRSGLSVRSRNGFFGTPDPPVVAKADVPESDLRKALLSPFEANGFPVRLSAFYSAGAGPLRTTLRTILMIDARDIKREKTWDGKERLRLDVLAALWGEGDRQITSVDKSFTVEKLAAEMDAAIKSGLAVELDVPVANPGPYQLRAAVRENSAGLMGSGSPATRVFASCATLHYDCQVFGAGTEKTPAKPQVEIGVHLFRGPELIFTGHPVAVPAEPSVNPFRANGTIRLPDSLPPGDYAMELVARDGPANPKRPYASQWVDFTLVSAP